MAPDDSPLCSKMNSAYSWWSSSHATVTPAPTPTTDVGVEAAAPECWTLSRPPPDSRPTCKVWASWAEIHYWPTPTPSGSDFCNSSWIAPTGTPTIPGKPNTAVVSGYTLTSPTIYQFFHGVEFSTFAGRMTRADGSYVGNRPSVTREHTITSAPSIYTVAKLETDILSVTQRRNTKRVNHVSVNPDFRINDIFTIRAEPWYGVGEGIRKPNMTIWQHKATPSIAVWPSDLVKQNGVKDLEDCSWYYSTTRYVAPAVLRGYVLTENFHAIVPSDAARPSSKTEPVGPAMAMAIPTAAPDSEVDSE